MVLILVIALSPHLISGHTTETFLTARKDIQVVAFDPLHYPYVGYCAGFLSGKYEDRFILIAGKMKSAIEVFAGYFGDKRFDMIYIDSGSYPTTAGIDSISCLFSEDDLSSSRFLAHSKSVVFMENVRPYSGTGSIVFQAWNRFVRSGSLRETADPRVWENLNRCLCEGVFSSDSSTHPVIIDLPCNYS